MQKPGRQIFTGHMFSPNKSSAVYEKTSPRSDLRWKPTSRIFKIVGLRWVLTRKIFASCTSKADNESTRGSNVDISKFHKCKQTLDLSADTSINSVVAEKADISETNVVVDSKLIRRMTLFGPLFDEYFNGEYQVVSKSSAVTTVDASDKRQQQSDSTLATTVSANGNFDV
ncbi:hypothetical protein Tco_0653048 [Tanacetum coccineum]|uniref:Uncharacterized protein n=1 Tax=Tanacetum coccineum TaxID=301880 RepID=A0ABQ4WZD2_9ASTR